MRLILGNNQLGTSIPDPGKTDVYMYIQYQYVISKKTTVYKKLLKKLYKERFKKPYFWLKATEEQDP